MVCECVPADDKRDDRKVTMTRLRLAIALIIIVSLVSACGPPQGAQPNKTTVSTKALEFTVEDLGGKQSTFTALRAGKPALVEFWGST